MNLRLESPCQLGEFPGYETPYDACMLPFLVGFMRAAAAGDDNCGVGHLQQSNTNSSCAKCLGVVLLESHSLVATAPTRCRGL